MNSERALQELKNSFSHNGNKSNENNKGENIMDKNTSNENQNVNDEIKNYIAEIFDNKTKEIINYFENKINNNGGDDNAN